MPGLPPGVPPLGGAPAGLEDEEDDEEDDEEEDDEDEDDGDDEEEDEDDDDGMDGIGMLGVWGPLEVDEQPATSEPSTMTPPATEARKCQLMGASLARRSRIKRVK